MKSLSVMNLRLISALCAGLALTSFAYGLKSGDVVERISTQSGKTYVGCRIFKVDPDGVMFSHKGGGAKVLFADMTESSRERCGYDANREAAYEKRLVEKKVQMQKIEAGIADVQMIEGAVPAPFSGGPAGWEASATPPYPLNNTLGYELLDPGLGYPIYPGGSGSGYGQNRGYGYGNGTGYGHGRNGYANYFRGGQTTVVPKNFTPRIVNSVSRPPLRSAMAPSPNQRFFAVPPLAAGLGRH